MYNKFYFFFLISFSGTLIRRASGDGERRRASLGAGMPSLRPGESTFDPTHAAILFRDSRGVRAL